jgi:hypothetical protein
MATAVLAVYVLGIVIGLIVMRDPWPTRVVTAVAWPLGIVAFVVVFVILSAAAVYLWPILMLATLALLAAAVWLVL